jgi:phosphoribosylformylglycinamidine synthase
LAREAALQRFSLEAVRAGLVASAHDLSDGGLAVALAESCITGKKQGFQPLGAQVRCRENLSLDALLFGESQSRVLFSADPDKAVSLEKLAKGRKVPLARIGTVGGGSLMLDLEGLGAKTHLDFDLDELQNTYEGTLELLN